MDVIWRTEHDHRMVARRYLAHIKDYRLATSLDGATISVDVWPVQSGDDAWFDIVPETVPLDGLIAREAELHTETTLALDPVTDLAELWPDIDFRDATLTSFSFAVTSRDRGRRPWWSTNRPSARRRGGRLLGRSSGYAPERLRGRLGCSPGTWCSPRGLASPMTLCDGTGPRTPSWCRCGPVARSTPSAPVPDDRWAMPPVSR